MAIWVIWLILLVGGIGLELVSQQLFSIWFSVGALGAIVSYFLGAPPWLQVLVFLVVTAASLAATRPLVQKIKPRSEPTNADRYVGQQAVVIEKIDNVKGTGAIKVMGQTWTARTKDGSEIPKGAAVHTLGIEGAKMFVELAD